MKKDRDVFNLTDVRKKPQGKDGLQIVTGFLAVRAGPPLSEAAFEKLYGGDQRGLEQKVTFENAEGIEEKTPRGRGTD
jgi:hypothetical protein